MTRCVLQSVLYFNHLSAGVQEIVQLATHSLRIALFRLCAPGCHLGLKCWTSLLCCRLYCEGQPCLPVGTSDLPGVSTVKVFCPRCEDVYYPRMDSQVRAS
jgi:hypothetical protein